LFRSPRAALGVKNKKYNGKTVTPLRAKSGLISVGKDTG